MNERDSGEIEKFVKHGEFVENEIMALYSLKKYRHMKNRYGDHGSYAIEVQRILEAAQMEST